MADSVEKINMEPGLAWTCEDDCFQTDQCFFSIICQVPCGSLSKASCLAKDLETQIHMAVGHGTQTPNPWYPWQLDQSSIVSIFRGPPGCPGAMMDGDQEDQRFRHIASTSTKPHVCRQARSAREDLRAESAGTEGCAMLSVVG